MKYANNIWCDGCGKPLHLRDLRDVHALDNAMVGSITKETALKIVKELDDFVKRKGAYEVKKI